MRTTAEGEAAATRKEDEAYIFMVHYMIERCLLLRMDRDETVRELAAQANIKPEVTEIVWKELVKANGDFFDHYFKTRDATRTASLVSESSSSRSNSPAPSSPFEAPSSSSCSLGAGESDGS